MKGSAKAEVLQDLAPVWGWLSKTCSANDEERVKDLEEKQQTSLTLQRARRKVG